jgi:hypothetical protein
LRLIRSWWRNPRTRYGSLVAALATILLMPIHSVGESAIAAMRNAAELLDARSPGERDGGILVQTKPARHHATPARTPRSRVLSETRSRPPGIGGGPIGPDVLFGDIPFGGFEPNFAPDGLGRELGHFGDLPTGGGPLLLYDTPQNTPDTVTPAVPEPGTYVLLILGIGVIGAAQRRRRRIRPDATTGADRDSGTADGTARILEA